MKLITKIYKILRYPFEAGLSWLFIFFILLEVPILSYGNYSVEKVFYICSFLSNFLCSYILVLPLFIAGKNNITKIIYFIIVGLFVLAWCVIDTICSSMNMLFYDDIAAIIKGTNFNEATEFVGWSINYKSFVILGTTIIFSTASYLLIKKSVIGKKVFYIGALLLFFAGIVMVVRNPESFDNSDFVKSMSFPEYKTPSYEDLLTNPSIEITDCLRPNNIVVVLGESLCRSHCSLYGYEKTTNPFLQEMADSGEILVFKEVTAPAIHTAEAVSIILTTRDKYIERDTCKYTLYLRF